MCRRFRFNGEQRCSAFPNGIPDSIWQNSLDHRQPYPGDNGRTFEQDPDKPTLPDFYDDLFRR
jgi:hypothetical protein